MEEGVTNILQIGEQIWSHYDKMKHLNVCGHGHRPNAIWNWTLFLKTVHQLICVLTSVREYSMTTHFCFSVVRGMFWWRLWDWTLVGWGHERSSGQYLQFFSSSDVMRLVSSGSVDLDWTWHGISHIFVQITNHSHLPPLHHSLAGYK